MPGYDLHTHSTFSDGTATPAENVRLAVDRGLEGIAVTDHDTTDGVPEAIAAADPGAIDIVLGLELSAEHDGASLHVLGYWVDPAHLRLRDELRRLHDTRFRRGELIVEKLHKLGYDVSFERVRSIAGDDLIARPHIAQAMVEAGIVATEKDAFDRYISDDGPAYVPKHALAPLDALALIRDAGGSCVLAHPGMWRGSESVPEDLIDAMAMAGMAGLEVDHPDHDEAQRARYGAIAEGLGLVRTGASDCHGARYDFRMGCETTAAELVDELRGRAPPPRPCHRPRHDPVTGMTTFVFLDIGGVVYDDRVYAEALRRALREAGAGFTDEAFDAEYAACRAAQNGSFRRRLATRFVGADADLEVLERLAWKHWEYPPGVLYADVVPTLEALREGGYGLGVIANQPTQVRAALERDGLVQYFEVWGVSEDLGLQKPDPALFVHAIRTAGVNASETVMVGDRLDYDVRPAKAAGMRTVWVLRGEAPDTPTPEQLAEPDAVVPDLVGLVEVISRLART